MVLWKLDCMKEAPRKAVVQIVQVLCPMCEVTLSKGVYIQPLITIKGNSNSLNCFESYLDYLDQPLKSKFLVPGTGVCVRLWFLKGLLSSLDCVCACLYITVDKYETIRLFFSRYQNSLFEEMVQIKELKQMFWCNL